MNYADLRRRFPVGGVHLRAQCDPLALVAALFPDRMLALVMTEVERMANDPLPVAQRAPRVAALERELDELHRAEEALVAAAIAERVSRARLIDSLACPHPAGGDIRR